MVLEKYSTGSWKITRVSSKAKIEEAREMLKIGGDVAAALRLLSLAVQIRLVMVVISLVETQTRLWNFQRRIWMILSKASWRLCNQQYVDFARTCSSELLLGEERIE